MAAYSEIQDLLIGDLMISSTVDKQQFITQAAEEMDSKLGHLYALPIPTNSLPEYQRLLLKGINNKLASGRLILTVNVGGEDTSLHAYGDRLVREAIGELMLIANGQINLEAPSYVGPVDEYQDKTPSIVNRDQESAVDMFEEGVMRGRDAYWTPGPVIPRGPVRRRF